MNCGNKEFNLSYQNYSKEELINKIKTLETHNQQLKNVLAKRDQIGNKKNKEKKPFDYAKCNYRKVLLKIYYLGWDCQGYASQEDSVNTIEYYLFEALMKVCLIKDRTTSNYNRCGRTDKGVSSFGQVISICLRSKLKENEMHKTNEEIEYCKILNRVLPDNIQCLAWCPAPSDDFSARSNCKFRTYKYFFPKGNLNIDKMVVASQYIMGTHDFRNFCKMDVGNGVTKFVRYIENIQIEPFEENNDDVYSMYVFTIKGNAFLWHQIRCIMGILFLIGQNKEEPELVKQLLNVDINRRKPEYYLANEIPLNLYFCEYGEIENWVYDIQSLSITIEKLKKEWMVHNIKSTMIRSAISDLESTIGNISKTRCFSEYLIQGIKSKNYVPVMKRQLCVSLEDKIQHHAKKCKINKTCNHK